MALSEWEFRVKAIHTSGSRVDAQWLDLCTKPRSADWLYSLGQRVGLLRWSMFTNAEGVRMDKFCEFDQRTGCLLRLSGGG